MVVLEPVARPGERGEVHVIVAHVDAVEVGVVAHVEAVQQVAVAREGEESGVLAEVERLEVVAAAVEVV